MLDDDPLAPRLLETKLPGILRTSKEKSVPLDCNLAESLPWTDVQLEAVQRSQNEVNDPSYSKLLTQRENMQSKRLVLLAERAALDCLDLVPVEEADVPATRAEVV